MTPDGNVTPLKPIPTNTRAACAEAMEKAKAHEPWFGIEQVRQAGARVCSSSKFTCGLLGGRWKRHASHSKHRGSLHLPGMHGSSEILAHGRMLLPSHLQYTVCGKPQPCATAAANFLTRQQLWLTSTDHGPALPTLNCKRPPDFQPPCLGVRTAQCPDQVASGLAQGRVPCTTGPLLLLRGRRRVHRKRRVRGALQVCMTSWGPGVGGASHAGGRAGLEELGLVLQCKPCCASGAGPPSCNPLAADSVSPATDWTRTLHVWELTVLPFNLLLPCPAPQAVPGSWRQHLGRQR